MGGYELISRALSKFLEINIVEIQMYFFSFCCINLVELFFFAFLGLTFQHKSHFILDQNLSTVKTSVNADVKPLDGSRFSKRNQVKESTEGLSETGKASSRQAT